MRAVRFISAAFALSLAGCITSGGGGGSGNGNNDNNGEEGNRGGKQLAGSLFGGGGNNQAGPNDEESPGQGGGEREGGDPPADTTTGGSVSRAACDTVCGQIIDCLSGVCGLELAAADRSDAVSACGAECALEASDDEIDQARQLTAEECAGLRQLDEESGFCGDLDEGDFEEGSSGSGSSSGPTEPTPVPGPGASAADCATFCDRGVECCFEVAEDADECREFGRECARLCAEEVPGDLVRCVVDHRDQSCDDISDACGVTDEETVDSTTDPENDAPAPEPVPPSP